MSALEQARAVLGLLTEAPTTVEDETRDLGLEAVAAAALAVAEELRALRAMQTEAAFRAGLLNSAELTS